jgi:hypothetical protein
MVDRHGWSYQEIANRLGSYPRHVERHYIASRVVEQARDLDIEGADNIRIGVLLRALQATGISEFLGIEYPADPQLSRTPVPSSKAKDFELFVWSTFGSDERAAVLPESRELTKWGRILTSPQAVAYLRTVDNPRFDRAWLKSGGQKESLIEMLNAAGDYLEDSIALVPDFREVPDVIEAVDRCSRRLHQILRDFDTIREETCDNSAA